LRSSAVLNLRSSSKPLLLHLAIQILRSKKKSLHGQRKLKMLRKLRLSKERKVASAKKM